jgi:molybdenum cofactor cytidylyltransferase
VTHGTREPAKPALAILAAGASRRLGQCKALVEWNGVTTLERLARAGAGLDARPALVVSGAHHELIAARAPAGLEVVLNAAWELGRLGSVRAARDARPGCDLCLAPVDTPLVERDVFEQLARAWQAAGAPAEGWLAPRTLEAAPRYGHPVVVGRALLAQLEQLGPGQSLRELRRRAQPLLWVSTASHAILDDLDTPEDLSRLRIRERAG